MSSSESTKQYEFSVSTNHIGEAISKLSAALCDLTEQALIDGDPHQVDGDFEQYCQDLRSVLVNRPDPFPSEQEEEFPLEDDIE